MSGPTDTKRAETIDANPWYSDPDHAAAGDDWAGRVRAGADGDSRNLLRELGIFLSAQRRAARETTDMQAVFETLGNFPVADILRVHTQRLPFVNSPEFIELWESRSMPDFRDESVKQLHELPPGTVGHEYARYADGWGMQNVFLRTMKIDSPHKYYGFRYAHMHDLLHFVLGYAPNHKSPEMEIEAFMYAQTGAANHVLFMLGFMRNLVLTDRRLAAKMPARLVRAYQRGARAENVLLFRWEDALDRPLEDVRAELRIDDRPTVPVARPEARGPQEVPTLAHAVLDVPDLDAAVDFYTETFGLDVSARDERLGVVFLTDGTDHHTLALSRSWPRGLLGPIKGMIGDIRLVRTVLKSRRGGDSRDAGRKTTLPPPRLYLERLRPGLNHLGYRVSSLEELHAWRQKLEDAGTPVDWIVNHNDMITGMYYRDPAGVRCEIFVDGDAVERLKEQRDAGAALDDLRVDDFRNWAVDLDEFAGGTGREDST